MVRYALPLLSPREEPHVTRPARAIAGVLTALALGTGLVGCGDSASAENTLTVYNAQHESLIKAMLAGFTDETGIAVEFRNGDDAELANQIVQEGEASPADVFLTENSPSMDAVDQAGLLAPVDASTLEQDGEPYRPSSGNWVGFAARSTVLVYNPSMIDEAELPASLMDLADPAWKGKVGIAAGGADFQAIVSAVLALQGEDATREWLDGLASNAEVYASNMAVMKAVDEGELPVGVIYHYYWYRDRAENGLVGDDTELHYFKNQDPGAFVSVSAAGVLKSSDQPADAQKLVAYLTSPEAQRTLAESDALEYAVGNGVDSAPALPPLADLQAPDVDPGSLNGPQVTELMQEAGLL
jgi:iron(III) transport system substrate-binding protein